MLKVEKRPDGPLHIRADGQLTTEDYLEFAPRFEALVSETPTAMLIELGPGFTGWSLGGLWRDLKFDFRHWKQFGRMAVIGDEKWQEWGADLSAPFLPGEVRFFKRGEEEKAENWLCGPAQESGDR